MLRRAVKEGEKRHVLARTYIFMLPASVPQVSEVPVSGPGIGKNAGDICTWTLSQGE